jgi:cyanate lyase
MPDHGRTHLSLEEVVELLRKRGLPLRFSLGRNSIREDAIGLIKKRVVYKFKEISNTKELLYYDIGTLVTSDGEIVGFYATVGLFGLKGEKWIKKYADTYLAATKYGVKVRKVTQRIGTEKVTEVELPTLRKAEVLTIQKFLQHIERNCHLRRGADA